MAHLERMRDVISGPFSLDILQQRAAAGWQMVSIDWQRELPDSENLPGPAATEEIPYGLRISADCKRLEIDPRENEILLRMMELLAQDFSYASIVNHLNGNGFTTREGRPWTRTAVFNLMPRLIEVGPRIFSSEAWVQRQSRLARPQPSAS